MNTGFDLASSIVSQISFFACRNVFLSSKVQKDISKYSYCKEFGISPYPGDYGSQPKKWVDKSFIIKNSLIKRENRAIKKQQAKQEG